MAKDFDNVEPLPEKKEDDAQMLKQLYKERGIQQQPFNDYWDLKQQEKKHKEFKIPPALKYALIAPFIIIFFAGLYFLPYMMFSIITAKPAEALNTVQQ